MTAEPIAKVVADLRAGKVKYPETLSEDLKQLALWGSDRIMPVIDATSIYESLIGGPSVNLYGDHTIPPAFNGANICYVNGHGNVIAMTTFAIERERVGNGWNPVPDWDSDQPMDWTEARWSIMAWTFIGGRSDTIGEAMPTHGPSLLLQYAVGTNGEPLDLHWIDLLRKAATHDGQMPKEWDMAMLVHLATLDFLACRNVEIVPVQHPNRAARRRVERTGVTVNTLTVKAVGRSSKGAALSGNHGVPLTSVRGHFMHFGDCCPGRHEPRGLAFGKLTGRFWNPQHARGDAELGEHRNDYRLEAG